MFHGEQLLNWWRFRYKKKKNSVLSVWCFFFTILSEFRIHNELKEIFRSIYLFFNISIPLYFCKGSNTRKSLGIPDLTESANNIFKTHRNTCQYYYLKWFSLRIYFILDTDVTLMFQQHSISSDLLKSPLTLHWDTTLEAPSGRNNFWNRYHNNDANTLKTGEFWGNYPVASHCFLCWRLINF